MSTMPLSTMVQQRRQCRLHQKIRKKEIALVTSIFSCFHDVIYPLTFNRYSSNLLNLDKAKILSFGKDLDF